MSKLSIEALSSTYALAYKSSKYSVRYLNETENSFEKEEGSNGQMVKCTAPREDLIPCVQMEYLVRIHVYKHLLWWLLLIIIMPLVAFTIQIIALEPPEGWDAVVTSFTKITYTHT